MCCKNMCLEAGSLENFLLKEVSISFLFTFSGSNYSFAILNSSLVFYTVVNTALLSLMGQLAIDVGADASLKCAVLLPLRRRVEKKRLFSHDRPQNGNSSANLPSRGQPSKAEEPASDSSPSIHPSIPEPERGL